MKKIDVGQHVVGGVVERGQTMRDKSILREVLRHVNVLNVNIHES
jgi:hypothetical protein